MEFVQEGTTKRYKGNSSCCIENFTPTMEDTYQYGCEFEFYVSTDINDYETIIDNITATLLRNPMTALHYYADTIKLLFHCYIIDLTNMTPINMIESCSSYLNNTYII